MVKITIAQNILAANDTIAGEIQQNLSAHSICTLNIMSSPGAGKTTLLEIITGRIAPDSEFQISKTNQLQTAEGFTLRNTRDQGKPITVNPSAAVEIDKDGVVRQGGQEIAQIELASLDLLVIENIGNLVCPAAWNLGEDTRVVVVSTTEGDDKPAKYPQMFAASEVMVVNKLDLLPYVDYDLQKVKRQALAINPHLRIFELSCRTGEGLDTWCEWLITLVKGVHV